MSQKDLSSCIRNNKDMGTILQQAQIKLKSTLNSRQNPTFYVDELTYVVEVTFGFLVILLTNNHIEHKIMNWNTQQ